MDRAGPTSITDLRFRHETDRRVNRVFDADATTADGCDGVANLRRINLCNESGARRFYLN